jgi:pyrimidine-nucleoside phosphorylase
MSVVELIERKRDGGRLSGHEWRSLMADYAAGKVPDYQLAALAMAVFFRGMDAEETEGLTAAMLESGKRLDLSHIPAPKVDKHSTGGVGDKVSLILAPLVAECGIAVPMMSGRGLGHTGGTLDKLESIPGFRTRLSLAQAAAQVERLGCVLIGQTDEIAPADRRLYALRDATATVEAIPLIAASIMSKKLAEGLTGLVLDVKTGAGAFMPRLDDALALAKAMIALGDRHGCATLALLTDMDSPLGSACGNAIEVEESIEVLRGGGPRDLVEVTLALADEMLVLAGISPDRAAARRLSTAAIASGAALDRFRRIIEAQGGDPRVVDSPRTVLPQAPVRLVVTAERAGVIQRIEPRIIGRAITALGGGRTKVEDAVDPAVGFLLHAKPGQALRAGDKLATILARDAASAGAARTALLGATGIGDRAPAPRPLVSHRVTAKGVEELAPPGAV